MFGVQPPAQSSKVMRIVKLSKDQPKRCIIVSSSMESLMTHYTHRSMICPGDGCPACEMGRQARYLAYVAVMVKEGVQLLRLTSRAADALQGSGIHVGVVFDALQRGPRSPVQLKIHKPCIVPPSQVINKLELLNVISNLHLLGGVNWELSYEDNCKILQDRALVAMKVDTLIV